MISRKPLAYECKLAIPYINCKISRVLPYDLYYDYKEVVIMMH